MTLGEPLPDGFSLCELDRVDSTNDEIRRRAAAGAKPGLVVLARQQTRGRGRHGRAWASPAGNLYASLLLQVDGPLATSAQLSFVAGLALNKKPDHLYVDNEEQKYWQRVRQSPARTAREVRARFRDIDRRLAEVETYYVTSNPRLSAEIERLR